MDSLQRRIGLLLLLTLVFIPGMLSAQDGEAVTAVGSGTVAPLFQALAAAGAPEINLSSTITGTNGGFEQFCRSQADLTAANRAISIEEDAACSGGGVDYVELLIAHHILAVVANPAAEYAQCLSSAALNAIFAPSAQDTNTNWNQIDVNNPDVPLTMFVPAEDRSAFALLDSIIGGDGIRADAVFESSDMDIIAAVSANTGAVGVVSLAAAEAAGEAVKILELNLNEIAGCTLPSAEAVENRLYEAYSPLFVYVNRAALDKPGLRGLLEFAVSEQASAIVTEQGFTPPTAAAYETDQAALEGTSERQFSRGVSDYEIPAALSGSITAGGSASGRDYMDSLISGFNALYPGVTTAFTPEGDPAGFRRLCNGELDLVLSTGELSSEQVQNCEANNITPLPIELGRRPVVLLANAGSDYLACLTTEQIKTAWSAESGSAITTWNQVSAEFPETSMTLFAPTEGSIYSDVLLLSAAGSSLPIRADTQISADPLYRAAATANVEGGLTYMSWAEYQRVLENNQANIQLVAVDAGSGCIAPSPETVADGSYPLALPARLIISEAALNRVEVQSFLWYAFSDENFGQFESVGLIGLSFGDLPALRDTLLQAYARAAEAARVPEATPEATAETTPEATPDATAEPAAETTPEG
ncbi:MAG: substrate-binding domain-containing protein [Chloroflexi bacterium]|nr:substrate-binding domain-containing protein [Chloroflexota bacterium]